ncbi:MAG TPA: gluconate 2-dehydrogenase subunit 3 family protein [Terriglobia bacterium]|nr:gluconate 2-dehydrogenase subunit 3 family protein [Terriglobia bacterium]
MRHEKKTGRSGSISRRDLLKAMSIAPAAGLIPLAPAMAALASPGETGDPSGPYAPKVFNPHEWRTIHVLSDLIVPADERTGSATQAGVPAFIDDWLNLKGGLLKTEVLGGLTWIDMECNRLFGRDFVDCSEGQQKQILDRIAYPGKAAPEDSNAVAAFNHIRDLVLEGFYSSKMGVEDLQYQGNKMLLEWDGCPEIVTSRLGVDYSDWENRRS